MYLFVGEVGVCFFVVVGNVIDYFFKGYVDVMNVVKVILVVEVEG